MGHSGATLLVGSCEPFSGKSALVMGLVQQLRDKGQSLRYGKPLATSIEQQTSGDTLIDDDVRFVGEIFDLPPSALLPSLTSSTPEPTKKQLATGSLVAPEQALEQLRGVLGVGEGITLLEAAGSLNEGLLFGLSLPQLAHGLQADRKSVV